MDLYVRNILEPEHGIADPINALHARRIEVHFLKQRAADPLHDVSFDLISDAIRIDNQAAVVSHGDSGDSNFSA